MKRVLPSLSLVFFSHRGYTTVAKSQENNSKANDFSMSPSPGDSRGKPTYRLSDVESHTSKEKGRVYRQHYNSKLPAEILAPLRVGNLHPDDIQAQEKQRDTSDPYSKDPISSVMLNVHSDKPINAEPPSNLLQHSWITPNEIFFIRNHHPVPIIDAENFNLTFSTSSNSNSSSSDFKMKDLSLGELQRLFPKREVVATIQCGGNRRKEMNSIGITAGTPWAVGALATAKWGGARLREVLDKLGVTIDFIDKNEIKHIQFFSVDGLAASIPIDTVLNTRSEVMLAWEMNDEPIPAAHGFPLRVIVPGHVGVRNVKWVNKIVLSKEEAPGPWQRGMAYKGFPPSLKTLDGIDTEKIPSLQEQPVQSSILMPTQLIAGQANVISGYAYSGGGRGIVRVDVSVDNGQTWIQARLGEGSQQDLNKSWAWTFWECDVLVPDTKSQLTVICKATDASYNVQPDSVAGIWNLRGINNNAWHRVNLPVVKEEEEEEEEEEVEVEVA